MSELSCVTLRKIEFVKSATRPSHYPDWPFPEVAFAGRSNVGKSSLINALLSRKGLVKVSSTPGRTQLINFFQVNDALGLVDLPGYGFARVPLEVKAKWGAMIEGYLSRRQALSAVIVIMDLRRGIEEDDMQLIEALPHYKIQPILVFTKADKYSRNAMQQRAREIAAAHALRADDLVLASSTKRQGLEVIWQRIQHMSGVKLV